jgi:anion-transporting  ArsA/GET3 family ATPase
VSDLAARLAGKRVVICAGAGGVGKTTVSATVALGLAARGQRVAVVTIDPARRLAESLGLDELGNQPQPVDPRQLASAGLDLRGGLAAMMLDAKRTFDELIDRLAANAHTRDQILANPVYAQLSTTVAGSQEYTAVAKLFELVRAGDYDVIVLDTPPSRSAIDFLQAPERLIEFLEGRALTAFMRPTGRAARAAGLLFAALRRITGVELLEDLTRFFVLLTGLLDGFRTRAADVRRLLADASTGFLIVTSPERTALQEALFFARELERAGMWRSGVIVNRVRPFDPHERAPETTAARLEGSLGAALAETVARVHADVQRLAHGDQTALQQLRVLLNDEPFCLSDRAADVHDLKALVELHRELFGSG